jgi:hypothetical protein
VIDAKKLHEQAQNFLTLTPDFVQFSSGVMTELKTKVEAESDPLKFQSEVMNAKRSLYNASFDGMIR